LSEDQAEHYDVDWRDGTSAIVIKSVSIRSV